MRQNVTFLYIKTSRKLCQSRENRKPSTEFKINLKGGIESKQLREEGKETSLSDKTSEQNRTQTRSRKALASIHHIRNHVDRKNETEETSSNGTSSVSDSATSSRRSKRLQGKRSASAFSGPEHFEAKRRKNSLPSTNSSEESPTQQKAAMQRGFGNERGYYRNCNPGRGHDYHGNRSFNQQQRGYNDGSGWGRNFAYSECNSYNPVGYNTPQRYPGHQPNFNRGYNTDDYYAQNIGSGDEHVRNFHTNRHPPGNDISPPLPSSWQHRTRFRGNQRSCPTVTNRPGMGKTTSIKPSKTPPSGQKITTVTRSMSASSISPVKLTQQAKNPTGSPTNRNRSNIIVVKDGPKKTPQASKSESAVTTQISDKTVSKSVQEKVIASKDSGVVKTIQKSDTSSGPSDAASLGQTSNSGNAEKSKPGDKNSGEDPKRNIPVTNKQPDSSVKVTEKPSVSVPKQNLPVTNKQPDSSIKVTEKPSVSVPKQNLPVTNKQPDSSVKVTEKPSVSLPKQNLPVTNKQPDSSVKVTEKPSVSVPKQNLPVTNKQPDSSVKVAEKPSVSVPKQNLPMTNKQPDSSVKVAEKPSVSVPKQNLPVTNKQPDSSIKVTEKPSVSVPKQNLPVTNKQPDSSVKVAEKPSVRVPKQNLPVTNKQPDSSVKVTEKPSVSLPKQNLPVTNKQPDSSVKVAEKPSVSVTKQNLPVTNKQPDSSVKVAEKPSVRVPKQNLPVTNKQPDSSVKVTEKPSVSLPKQNLPVTNKQPDSSVKVAEKPSVSVTKQNLPMTNKQPESSVKVAEKPLVSVPKQNLPVTNKQSDSVKVTEKPSVSVPKQNLPVTNKQSDSSLNVTEKPLVNLPKQNQPVLPVTNTQPDSSEKVTEKPSVSVPKQNQPMTDQSPTVAANSSSKAIDGRNANPSAGSKLSAEDKAVSSNKLAASIYVSTDLSVKVTEKPSDSVPKQNHPVANRQSESFPVKRNNNVLDAKIKPLTICTDPVKLNVLQKKNISPVDRGASKLTNRPFSKAVLMKSSSVSAKTHPAVTPKLSTRDSLIAKASAASEATKSTVCSSTSSGNGGKARPTSAVAAPSVADAASAKKESGSSLTKAPESGSGITVTSTKSTNVTRKLEEDNNSVYGACFSPVDIVGTKGTSAKAKVPVSHSIPQKDSTVPSAGTPSTIKTETSSLKKSTGDGCQQNQVSTSAKEPDTRRLSSANKETISVKTSTGDLDGSQKDPVATSAKESESRRLSTANKETFSAKTSTGDRDGSQKVPVATSSKESESRRVSTANTDASSVKNGSQTDPTVTSTKEETESRKWSSSNTESVSSKSSTGAQTISGNVNPPSNKSLSEEVKTTDTETVPDTTKKNSRKPENTHDIAKPEEADKPGSQVTTNAGKDSAGNKTIHKNMQASDKKEVQTGTLAARTIMASLKNVGKKTNAQPTNTDKETAPKPKNSSAAMANIESPTKSDSAKESAAKRPSLDVNQSAPETSKVNLAAQTSQAVTKAESVNLQERTKVLDSCATASDAKTMVVPDLEVKTKVRLEDDVSSLRNRSSGNSQASNTGAGQKADDGEISISLDNKEVEKSVLSESKTSSNTLTSVEPSESSIKPEKRSKSKSIEVCSTPKINAPEDSPRRNAKKRHHSEILKGSDSRTEDRDSDSVASKFRATSPVKSSNLESDIACKQAVTIAETNLQERAKDSKPCAHGDETKIKDSSASLIQGNVKHSEANVEADLSSLGNQSSDSPGVSKSLQSSSADAGQTSEDGRQTNQSKHGSQKSSQPDLRSCLKSISDTNSLKFSGSPRAVKRSKSASVEVCSSGKINSPEGCQGKSAKKRHHSGTLVGAQSHPIDKNTDSSGFKSSNSPFRQSDDSDRSSHSGNDSKKAKYSPSSGDSSYRKQHSASEEENQKSAVRKKSRHHSGSHEKHTSRSSLGSGEKMSPNSDHRKRHSSGSDSESKPKRSSSREPYKQKLGSIAEIGKYFKSSSKVETKSQSDFASHEDSDFKPESGQNISDNQNSSKTRSSSAIQQSSDKTPDIKTSTESQGTRKMLMKTPSPSRTDKGTSLASYRIRHKLGSTDDLVHTSPLASLESTYSPKRVYSRESTQEDSTDNKTEDSEDDAELDEVPMFLRTTQHARTAPAVGDSVSSDESDDSDMFTDPVGFHPGLPIKEKNYKFSLDNLLTEKIEREEQDEELEAMQEELKAGIQQGGFVRLTVLENPDEEHELLPEQQEQLKMLAVSKQLIVDDHPGVEVFVPERYKCLFSEDLSLRTCGFIPGKSYIDKHLASLQPGQAFELWTSNLLSMTYEKISCQDAVFTWLLYIIHPSRLVVDKCRQDLAEILFHQQNFQSSAPTWAPSLKTILRILINYGASMKSLCVDKTLLCMSDDEIRVLETPLEVDDVENRPPGVQGNMAALPSGQLNRENFRQVLQVVAIALNGRPNYSHEQLLALSVILCMCALDIRISKPLMLDHDIQVCLATLLESYTDTDWPQQAAILCHRLSFMTSHHHNRLHVVQLFPLTIRGQYIQRRLSYLILCDLLKVPKQCTDLHSLKVGHLHVMVGRLRELVNSDLYLMANVISLLDKCVGYEVPKSSEKNDLRKLTDAVRMLTGEVRDNVSMLDKTKVKDMMVRMTSTWTFTIQSMGSKQPSLFASRMDETPSKMPVEIVTSKGSDSDSSDDDDETDTSVEHRKTSRQNLSSRQKKIPLESSSCETMETNLQEVELSSQSLSTIGDSVHNEDMKSLQKALNSEDDEIPEV